MKGLQTEAGWRPQESAGRQRVAKHSRFNIWIAGGL